MRSALLVVHRWLALLLAVFILILGLTGSALVFEGAIDRGMHPELWNVKAPPSGVSLRIDSLAAIGRAALGGHDVTNVSLPVQPDRALVVQAGVMSAFIDPYTGHVNGLRDAREFDRSLPRVLHRLHTSLLVRGIGSFLVGISTIATLLLVITGVVVWWRDKLWRINWRAPWKRVNFDWHHAFGVFATPVLLVITFTGVLIAYDGAARGVADLLGGSARKKVAVQKPAPPGTPTISLDSAVGVARHALPGASVMFVSPGDARSPIVVGMRYQDDRTPAGRSRVFVDRFAGVLLLAQDTHATNMGDSFMNKIRPLHTGDIGGKVAEFVWLLAALVLVGQVISGVLMWWNGRAARVARRRRAASTG